MPPIPPEICTFTGLETALLSLLIAIVAGIGTFLGMGKRFMSRTECVLRHQNVELADEQNKEARSVARQQIKRDVDKLLSSSNIQFKMLRGIVTYMDLPPEVKEKLLNKTPGPDND